MSEPAGSIRSEGAVSGSRSGTGEPETGIRQVWRGVLLVYLVFFALMGAKLYRPDTVFTGRDNVQIAEAESWWSGRVDLKERRWDTAEANGRYYSHFPPMFTVIAAGLVPFFGGVPHWFVLTVLVLPIPGLCFFLFRRRTGSVAWGAVLAIGCVCGTSAWPVIDKALRGASPYYVNHVLALIGLLVFLLEYFGRRRIWIAGLGLIIAGLSRQLTAAFVIPLVVMAIAGASGEHRPRRLLSAAVVVAVLVSVPLVLSALKFGHPLDTGYLRIYEGRDDKLATDAKTYGLFSPHFAVRNLYYANIGLPRVQTIEVAGERQTFMRPNVVGTGIWWTTPLLLWVIFGFRRIVSDPTARWLLPASALVYVALLFFHGTGAEQRGFNRFSLDYMPVLLALVAPHCITGRRRWITAAMVAWSVVYFGFVLAQPNIRLWSW